MFDLTAAKPSSALSFTRQTTIKKIYERENSSLGYQLIQEPEEHHKQPQRDLLLTSDTSGVLQEAGRLLLKRHRNLPLVPPFTPSGFNVNDRAPRASSIFTLCSSSCSSVSFQGG